MDVESVFVASSLSIRSFPILPSSHVTEAASGAPAQRERRKGVSTYRRASYRPGRRGLYCKEEHHVSFCFLDLIMSCASKQRQKVVREWARQSCECVLVIPSRLVSSVLNGIVSNCCVCGCIVGRVLTGGKESRSRRETRKKRKRCVVKR